MYASGPQFVEPAGEKGCILVTLKQDAQAQSAADVVKCDYGVVIGNERRRYNSFDLRPHNELHFTAQRVSLTDTAELLGDKSRLEVSATAKTDRIAHQRTRRIHYNPRRN
jgi:hypothetical protein